MRIAVLGGGNGAYAAAADLAERGHEVRLWRRDRAALGALAAGGGRITLEDVQGAHAVSLALASAEPGPVLQGAALVIVAAPAFAQAGIAAAMAPHLADGQVVLLPPGSFGSYAMAAAVRAAGSRARVSFAESGTLPYLARKHGPATVAIAARATRLPTGVFPLADAERALAVIAAAYPSVEPCGDALSGALMNAGPIIHPPLILMNAGPLEHFPRWDIHNEGTQPSIRRVTTALDEERIALRGALGYGPPHFPLADHYRREPAAKRGCMAPSVTSSLSTAATGARRSTSPRIATCARTWSMASPSWCRWRVGPGLRRRWRRGCWRLRRRCWARHWTPPARAGSRRSILRG